jgi:Tetratricopeptide repeat
MRAQAEHDQRDPPTPQGGGAPETLRIWLLGGFRVSVGSRSIGEQEWHLRKARSLVKLLALAEGHSLHREQAMELLWPDLDPKAALTNLGMAAVLGQREDIPLRTVMEGLGELKPHLENRTTLAYLLILEGLTALSQGDLEHSVALHEESLKLFRETQDTRGILNCLIHLGGIALVRGDYEGALSLLQESLRLGWELDDTVQIQVSLHGLASVVASREQPVRAVRLWGPWKACTRITACTSRPWPSPLPTTRAA